MEALDCGYGICEGCSSGGCYWTAFTTGECLCLANTSGILPDTLSGMVRPGKYCGTFSSYFCRADNNVSTTTPFPSEVSEDYVIATEALGVLLGVTIVGAIATYWRRGLMSCSRRGFGFVGGAVGPAVTWIRTFGGAGGHALQGAWNGLWQYILVRGDETAGDDSTEASLTESLTEILTEDEGPVGNEAVTVSVASQTEGWDNPAYDADRVEAVAGASTTLQAGTVASPSPANVTIVPTHLPTPARNPRDLDFSDGPSSRTRSKGN